MVSEDINKKIQRVGRGRGGGGEEEGGEDGREEGGGGIQRVRDGCKEFDRVRGGQRV